MTLVFIGIIMKVVRVTDKEVSNVQLVMSKDVENFLDKLQLTTKSKVSRLVLVLSQLGNEVREPYSKKLGKNLYELRIRGGEEVRVFYTFKNNEIILFHAFVKKKQKTPLKELRLGLKKLRDVENR